MTDIFFFFFKLVKRAGRHFGFFKRAGRHEKGAGRRALQKKPRQNTDNTMSKVGNAKIALFCMTALLLYPHANDPYTFVAVSLGGKLCLLICKKNAAFV